ncbi:sulfite exporter TauE/SafE family protein [Hyalangium versicolor]|uniref:sulfite exporter TauE/SafE family protein n=1 Tax=Hyalangium versicolor TaxID=2861190 RepID=UPI001CCD1A9B|nr:sulfite exporter TauE/SafE family protein [Hyalangium versicolor]
MNQAVWLLAGAGFLAGAMNAVAGGGSFVTLPALILAGLPSVGANASSAVALFPASLASTWAYRRELADTRFVALQSLLPVSLVGGAVGAALLLATPSTLFDAILPWLLLLATLSFAFGQQAGLALRRLFHIGPRALLLAQFLLAVYGGYFGGAVGIMMMATWSLLSAVDIKAMNPPKTLLVAATNAIAVLCFIAARQVWWKETLAMLIAAALGGYAGAHLARWLEPQWLRRGVILLTAGMTLAFFLRAR